MIAASLFWLGVIVGLILLVRFLRGHRIGDHSYCRRCSFDLTGLPHTSIRCPECGSDITAPRSTRIGQRVRPKRIGTIAIVLLMVSLPFVAVTLTERLSSIDLVKHKPAFWLAYDARTNNRRADVLNELLNRVSTGGLKPAAISSLIDHALSQQVDRTTAWDPAWGDFIERCDVISAISTPQWERYVRQIAYFELRANLSPRPGEIHQDPNRVRRNSELLMTLVRHYRAGTKSALLVSHNDLLFIGETALSPAGFGTPGSSGHKVSDWVCTIPTHAVRDRPDGPITATAKVYVRVHRGWSANPVARFEQSIPITFTLAPHHDYTDAPGHRAAFERALNFSNIHVTGHTLHLTAIINNPPVGFAHTLVLKSSKGDVAFAPLICPAGQSANGEFHIDLRSADLPTARLHFVPLDAVVSQIEGIPVVWSGSLDRPLPVKPSRLP